jgi:putative DNA methylase
MACANPACREDVPLVRSWVLAHRGTEVWFIQPNFDSLSRDTSFEVLRANQNPEIPPTIDGANLSCPFCGEVTAAKDVREYARNTGFRYRMLAVIEQEKPRGRKHYRSVTQAEVLRATEDASSLLSTLDRMPPYSDGTPVVIDEPMPPRGTLGFRVNNYGMKSWRDIYLSRQLCAVTYFAEAVAALGDAEDSPAAAAPKDVRVSISVLMACALSKMAVYNTSTCRWQAGTAAKRGEFPVDTFGGGQKLSMTWDFVETSPLSFGSGSWKVLLRMSGARLHHYFA